MEVQPFQETRVYILPYQVLEAYLDNPGINLFKTLKQNKLWSVISMS